MTALLESQQRFRSIFFEAQSILHGIQAPKICECSICFIAIFLRLRRRKCNGCLDVLENFYFSEPLKETHFENRVATKIRLTTFPKFAKENIIIIDCDRLQVRCRFFDLQNFSSLMDLADCRVSICKPFFYFKNHKYSLTDFHNITLILFLSTLPLWKWFMRKLRCSQIWFEKFIRFWNHRCHKHSQSFRKWSQNTKKIVVAGLFHTFENDYRAPYFRCRRFKWNSENYFQNSNSLLSTFLNLHEIRTFIDGFPAGIHQDSGWLKM